MRSRGFGLRGLAPFEALLAALNPDDAEVTRVAEELYAGLRDQGVDVLYDDRDERPDSVWVMGGASPRSAKGLAEG